MFFVVVVVRPPLFSILRPDEKVTRVHNESPQHYLPSTLSSTSGISTGPSSSYGTQLTTPSSFTKLSSTSFTEETVDNRPGISCFPEEYLSYCNQSILEGREPNENDHFGKFYIFIKSINCAIVLTLCLLSICLSRSEKQERILKEN